MNLHYRKKSRIMDKPVANRDIIAHIISFLSLADAMQVKALSCAHFDAIKIRPSAINWCIEYLCSLSDEEYAALLNKSTIANLIKYAYFSGDAYLILFLAINVKVRSLCLYGALSKCIEFTECIIDLIEPHGKSDKIYSDKYACLIADLSLETFDKITKNIKEIWCEKLMKRIIVLGRIDILKLLHTRNIIYDFPRMHKPFDFVSALPALELIYNINRVGGGTTTASAMECALLYAPTGIFDCYIELFKKHHFTPQIAFSHPSFATKLIAKGNICNFIKLCIQIPLSRLYLNILLEIFKRTVDDNNINSRCRLICQHINADFINQNDRQNLIKKLKRCQSERTQQKLQKNILAGHLALKLPR